MKKNKEQKKEALTKEDFLKALTKATKIVQKPEEGKKRTSGENLSDGYSGKHTHSDKLKVLRRYRMINTLDTIFDQRPKALDGVGMAVADNIDLFAMLNSGMIKAESRKAFINRVFIREDLRRLLNIGNNYRNNGPCRWYSQLRKLPVFRFFQPCRLRGFCLLPHAHACRIFYHRNRIRQSQLPH